MSSPRTTSSKSGDAQPQNEEAHRFSLNFVSWCGNCLNPFHYFDATKCSFIYQIEPQEDKSSSLEEAEKTIVGFYCPDCEEALAQAQPTFAHPEETGEVEGEGEEQASLAEEWSYPTDEELEDALEWATERI